MNPEVDSYFETARAWRDELAALRCFALDSGIMEELKWRQPCYTLDGKNVLIIGAFKDYCALMFFKGALLADERQVLIRPGNHTQAVRQLRFTSVAEIEQCARIIDVYICEAIEIERAGLKVPMKSMSDYEIPAELAGAFVADSRFN